jgi:hypothetical protein
MYSCEKLRFSRFLFLQANWLWKPLATGKAGAHLKVVFSNRILSAAFSEVKELSLRRGDVIEVHFPCKYEGSAFLYSLQLPYLPEYGLNLSGAGS